MILRSIYNKINDYGFPIVMEYSNPNFYGHRKSVCIGVKNEKQETIRNYMPDKKEESFNKIIEDKDIILQTETYYKPTSVFAIDSLPEREIYYFISYFVDNHPIYKVDYKKNPTEYDKHFKASIGILFVHDSLDRFITFEAICNKSSLFEIIDNLFNEISCNKKSIPGLIKTDDNISFDFYDEYGNKHDIIFTDINDIKKCIIRASVLSIDSIEE